jgi:hypothetical protein
MFFFSLLPLYAFALTFKVRLSAGIAPALRERSPYVQAVRGSSAQSHV